MGKPNTATLAWVIVGIIFIWFLWKSFTPQISIPQIIPTVTLKQPIAPKYAQAANCIEQANLNYAVQWANACYTTTTGLSTLLENCQLSQYMEDKVDQERLDAIEACYSSN